MKVKKVILMMALSIIVLALVACGEEKDKSDSGSGNSKDSDTLVLYSTENEAIINAIIPLFEEESGLKVEIVSAGTGELMKRIESEKENPYGDVMFGGNSVNYVDNKELFEDYVSKNNDDVLDEFKNTKGFVTPHVSIGYTLLYNTELIGDIKIDGYEDLLQPALKGKISMGDPGSSSSSFGQLMNMLLAMGGDFESEAGWDYVSDFIDNLDGKIASSSGAVHKGVADGEFIVGLNIEGQAVDYKQNGAPVEIIYPEEGAIFIPGNSGIIKNANNMEGAQQFIDFLTSTKAQEAFTNVLPYRSIRGDVEAGEALEPLEAIKVLDSKEDEANEKKEQIIDMWIEKITDSRE